MAVAKLGAIITDISGSIGGTTFRRSATGQVIYNKPKGTGLGRTKGSLTMSANVKTILGWNQISQAERDAWAQLAADHPVVDKFGDLKNLTGRQYYIRNTSACQVAGYAAPEPDGLAAPFPFGVEVLNTVGEVSNNVITNLRYTVKFATENNDMRFVWWLELRNAGASVARISRFSKQFSASAGFTPNQPFIFNRTALAQEVIPYAEVGQKVFAAFRAINFGGYSYFVQLPPVTLVAG